MNEGFIRMKLRCLTNVLKSSPGYDDSNLLNKEDQNWVLSSLQVVALVGRNGHHCGR